MLEEHLANTSVTGADLSSISLEFEHAVYSAVWSTFKSH